MDGNVVQKLPDPPSHFLLLITYIFPHSETTKHCVESAVRNYVTKTVINGELTEIDTIKAVTSVSLLFFLLCICQGLI